MKKSDKQARMRFGQFVPDGLGRLIYSGLQGAYCIEGVFKYGSPCGYVRQIWNDSRMKQGMMTPNFKFKKQVAQPEPASLSPNMLSPKLLSQSHPVSSRISRIDSIRSLDKTQQILSPIHAHSRNLMSQTSSRPSSMKKIVEQSTRVFTNFNKVNSALHQFQQVKPNLYSLYFANTQGAQKRRRVLENKVLTP